MLLTDHGRPNLASSSFRKIIDGVTIVGGSEASLPDGRLTFFGAQEAPGFRLSSFPPEAMDDARGWGAFPVLAYPDDPDFGWRYWDSGLRPGGIEVLNLFTSLRGASWAERMRLGMYYPFSHYYFLKSITIPAESLAHWDGFLQRGKIWGFEASDAHGGFRVGSWLAMKVPSYADTFSFVGMGISRRYEADPEAAVRSGDFFNCIRGAGEPERFEFSARRGLQEIPSGGNAPVNSSLHVSVQMANQAVRVVLKKDGAGGARDCGGSSGFGRRCRRSLSRGSVFGGAPFVAGRRAVDSFESDFCGDGTRGHAGAAFHHHPRAAGWTAGDLQALDGLHRARRKS